MNLTESIIAKGQFTSYMKEKYLNAESWILKMLNKKFSFFCL